jgi:hypothetical protein
MTHPTSPSAESGGATDSSPRNGHKPIAWSEGVPVMRRNAERVNDVEGNHRYSREKPSPTQGKRVPEREEAHSCLTRELITRGAQWTMPILSGIPKTIGRVSDPFLSQSFSE